MIQVPVTRWLVASFRLEYEWRKRTQISAPHHPCVHTRRFNVCKLHAFVLQPGLKLAIHFDQAVFSPACDPKQLQLLISVRVHTGELIGEVAIVDSTRAERTDPAKLVGMV